MPDVFTNNQWVHLTILIDGQVVKIYVNGTYKTHIQKSNWPTDDNCTLDIQLSAATTGAIGISHR